MLPTTTPSKSPHASASRARPSVEDRAERRSPPRANGSLPSGSLASSNEPLKPIGPERMRALRQAIQEGTYPSEADVLGGLERLLGDPSE